MTPPPDVVGGGVELVGCEGGGALCWDVEPVAGFVGALEPPPLVAVAPAPAPEAAVVPPAAVVAPPAFAEGAVVVVVCAGCCWVLLAAVVDDEVVLDVAADEWEGACADAARRCVGESA